MFLTSLEISADLDERRVALTRARDHGLDMERVAIATAERTIEKAFEASNLYLSVLLPMLSILTLADSSSIERGTPFNHQHAALALRRRKAAHSLD